MIETAYRSKMSIAVFLLLLKLPLCSTLA